ncbi:MAG: phosphate acyltransferase PlsX [Chlamydiales bacterium]|nr:phosphate acyltransferase PlsX [Chlamydiales bacterium]
MRIGVDLMGSDRTPEEIFEAVLEVSSQIADGQRLVVYGTEEILSSLSVPPVIEKIAASQVVRMDEAPLHAFRHKKNSSMASGILHVKEKALDGFVSTGNTGALMATALFRLKRLPNVSRPALMVIMPNGQKDVVVLDVGANLTPKPEHIVDFARMGAAYRTIMHGIKNPSTGLLNVGAEEQKGPKELKETYQLMQKTFGAAFKGNVEGREVFDGKVDVLVTDGFTGNVFLKTCEGISSFLFHYLHEKFSDKVSINEIASHLYNNFNYAKHPGALLCGVDGLIVKCHGHSNQQALVNGILGAFRVAEQEIVSKMKEALK